MRFRLTSTYILTLLYLSTASIYIFAENFKSLNALSQEEIDLKSSYDELSKTGLDVDSLVKSLTSDLDESKKKDYLKDWQTKVRSFQEKYDSFNNGKLDFIAERYIGLAREIGSDVLKSKNIDLKTKQSIKARLEYIESQYNRYNENKGRAGKTNDRQRTIGINNFLNAIEVFAQDAGRTNRSWNEGLRLKLGQLAEKARFITGVSAMLLTLPISVLRAAMGKSALTSAKLPFSAAMMAQNRHLTIQGNEILKGPQEAKTLRFLALTHEHNANDFASLTKMASEKTAVVTAISPPNVMGLKTWFDSRPEFISVGAGGDGAKPTTKIAERVMSGAIDTLAIFPEAAMPAYGYELRKAQDSMGTLLKMIQKGGTPVEILPVAFPRHAQFLKKIWQSSHPLDSRELPVVVGSVIPASVVAFVTKNGDRESLGDIIRQSWIQSYDSDKFQNRILGTPPIKTLVGAIDGVLQKNTGCGTWISNIGKTNHGATK